jgi:acetyl-CoA carboxylase biotin carboxyl carrier protein
MTMALSDEDIREILRIIDESPLEELRIETKGFSLHVLRGGRADTGSRAPATARGGREPASTRPADTPKLAEAPTANGLVTIEAPMLGTFYRAEGPGKQPFVDVGVEVEADSTVCIIEVMKMMNSVPAGIAGTIVEICSENAEMVEYGAPLFRVRPA